MEYNDTVLFVDDEVKILNTLRWNSLEENYRCLFAQSGHEALNILSNEQVSVIVSDINMPGMDGLKLLSEVKARYPDVVRVVLSSYTLMQQVLITVDQADIFKFIIKPWNRAEEYKSAIDEALEYHRQQRQRAKISDSFLVSAASDDSDWLQGDCSEEQECPRVLEIVGHADQQPILNVLKSAYAVSVRGIGDQSLFSYIKGYDPSLIIIDSSAGLQDEQIGMLMAFLRDDSKTAGIPIVIVQSESNPNPQEKYFGFGATDCLKEPLPPVVLVARVRTHVELSMLKRKLNKQRDYLDLESSRRLRETQLVQDLILGVITQLVEARDVGTAFHISHTRAYVEILARSLKKSSKYSDKLNEQTISLVVKASTLHDIGKIGVPDSILLKDGGLSDAEFEMMKRHCEIGSNAIRSVINRALRMNIAEKGRDKPESLMFLEIAEEIAKYHHEKWDGSGYPSGLKGEQIPLYARMMALADVYDALTSKRSYKGSWDAGSTAEHIIGLKGTHFDPDIVDAFEAEKESFMHIHERIMDNWF